MKFSSSHLLALGIILCLAAALRLPRLDTVPAGLWTDEANKALNAAALARGERPLHLVYYNEAFPKEGTFDTLLAGVVKLAGPNVVALRTTSAIIGLLAVLLLYLALRGEAGEGVALTAAGVLATMFWHVLFSRLIFRAILMTPWLTGLLWAILALHRRPGRARAALLGFMIGGGFYTYPSWYFLLIWLAGVVVWLFWPSRPRRLRLGLLGWLLGAAALAAMPLGLDYFHHPDHLLTRGGAVSPFTQGPAAAAREIVKNTRDALLMFHWRGEHQPLQNIPHKPALDPLQGVAFLVGLILCVRSLWRRRRQGTARIIGEPNNGGWRHDEISYGPLAGLLVGWLFCGLLATILTKTDSPNFLRTLAITPAVAAITGLGLAAAGRWIARRMSRVGPAWGIALVTLVLAISALLTGRDLFVRWAHHREVWTAYRGDFADMARQAALAPPDVAVFVPQLIFENQTFRFFTLAKSGPRANIYPYNDWSFLKPWSPKPAVNGQLASSRPPTPRRRWIIVTAANGLLQPLMQLAPQGAVVKQFHAPPGPGYPQGNTYAAVYALSESDLPSTATVQTVESRWRGELRL